MVSKLSDPKSSVRSDSGRHFIEVEPDSTLALNHELIIDTHDGFRLTVTDSFGAVLAAQFVSSLRAGNHRDCASERSEKGGQL